MKIAFFVEKKFINHYIIVPIIKAINDAINNDNKNHIYYILDDTVIEAINLNYDAIYTRFTFPNEYLLKVNIPIFSQHESPYNNMNNFSNKLIYLTDVSLLNHFPMAEEEPSYINFRQYNDFESRNYDISFLGRYVDKKNELNTEEYNNLNSELEKYINRIITPDKFKELLQNNKKLNLENKDYQFFWHLVHGLRNKRRDIIVKELYKLADIGYKVCMIVDKESKSRLKNHKNIDFYFDLNLDEVYNIFKDTKSVVVQTPLHFSIYNERFTAALECGAIPLCENYPQYQEFYKDNNELFYNYKDKKLTQVVDNLLKKDKLKRTEIIKKIELSSKEYLSKKLYISKFKKLIKKYENYKG